MKWVVVGNGLFYQSVSESLTVEKSGGKKRNWVCQPGKEVWLCKILQNSRQIGVLTGSYDTILSYDDAKVVPTEDVNNGRIEVEVLGRGLEKGNWGNLLEKGRKWKFGIGRKWICLVKQEQGKHPGRGRKQNNVNNSRGENSCACPWMARDNSLENHWRLTRTGLTRACHLARDPNADNFRTSWWLSILLWNPPLPTAYCQGLARHMYQSTT